MGIAEEALRYLGVRGPVPEALRRETDDVLRELEEETPPRWTYRLFSLERGPDGPALPGAGLVFRGRTAEKMLAECDQAVLLACTLGSVFDAKMRAEQARSMARAVLLDACGSALTESGCDAAEEELRRRFPDRYLTDRFSPGYGDLPLELQPGICRALDVRRRLGLSVTESLLLNPAKSVTAIIGLSDRPQTARIRGCAYCALRQTCALRKEGKNCAI